MSVEDVDDFLEWSRQQGIETNGLQLVHDQESGYGLVATRDFHSEESLIRLPQSSMITAGSVGNIPKYAHMFTNMSCLPTPFEALTIYFACEEPATSQLGPYLKILPKNFTTPISTDTQLEVSDLPASIGPFWEYQQREIRTLREKIQSLGASCSSISDSKLLWAWNVVNSRCLFVENRPHKLIDQSQGDTIAVVPFVDLLNHSPSAQGIALLDKRSATYMVKASRFISKGSQVFVCYGPHSNARLFIEYGFRLADNPYIKVIFNHNCFLRFASEAGITVSEVRENTIRKADLPCHLYATDEGPSWPLRINARLLTIPENYLENWEQIIYEEPEEDSERERQEAETDKILTVILKKLREHYETRIQQVHPEARWMWKEELAVIDSTLAALQTEGTNDRLSAQ